MMLPVDKPCCVVLDADVAVEVPVIEAVADKGDKPAAANTDSIPDDGFAKAACMTDVI